MAEKEHIERDIAINEVLMGDIDKDYPRMDIAARLHDIPAADVVTRDCYERILWENDIMRQQLADIGKAFAEKMDDVRPVVLCKDCIHRRDRNRQSCQGRRPDFFCADGKRSDDA